MNTERNIVIIVHNLSVPFDRRVWQEAVSLRRNGFGVAVICPKNKTYKANREMLEGVDIYRYSPIYEASKSSAGYFAEFLYRWLATLLLTFRAYLHRPFHAIHACNPPDIYFALALLFRPLGVKFVFDHHDLCPEMYIAKGRPRRGLLYRGLLILEHMTLRSAHAILAVNESHKAIALDRGGVPERRVTIVRSGPPLDWADIDVPCTQLKRGHKYMVLYLGEMCEQDGVDHLLRAMQCYRNFGPEDTIVVFVGGGPHQPRLKTIAEQMGLGTFVHFTGRIPDQELWQYLSTADVCVDPDPLTEWSNLSTMNKMIEYMAFGRPIVAFDLTEHRRSAESAAVYVTGNDDMALAHAIRELLLDPERRHGMAQYGRARFRQVLSWENSEKALIAAYRRMFDQ